MRPPKLPSARPARLSDPVGSYAWDMCKGRVVACRLVRLAAERHWRDIANGAKRGLRYDAAMARHAIGFFARFLRHSKSEWAGHPVLLEPWQEFIVGSVFGWFNREGLRRFRSVYDEIARKNGKSCLLAGVGIYGLVADGEPGCEIYAAATRRDQARIIFSEAQRMVRRSPELSAKIGVFKYNMSIDGTASLFEPLSADDRTLDGLNPHFVLIDEIHKHRSRAVIDVLDTAMGARREPLIWMITTAGDDNPESVYAHENAYAVQVLEGAAADDTYFAYIATLRGLRSCR
jgi:phage terminase large subunit-like protein